MAAASAQLIPTTWPTGDTNQGVNCITRFPSNANSNAVEQRCTTLLSRQAVSLHCTALQSGSAIGRLQVAEEH